MVESTIEATPISTPIERVVTYSVVGAGAKLVSPVDQE